MVTLRKDIEKSRRVPVSKRHGRILVQNFVRKTWSLTTPGRQLRIDFQLKRGKSKDDMPLAETRMISAIGDLNLWTSQVAS